MGESPPAGSSGETLDADLVHRVSVLISLGLAGGVLVFLGVAVFLVETGNFTPFLGVSGLARGGIGAFLILLLGISYPLQAQASGGDGPASAGDPVTAFQTGLIVANAVRDAAGIMGCVLILLAGDYLIGGTAAVLAIATIVLSVPSREQVRALASRRR